MVGEKGDRQTRIKCKILDELDELTCFHRKDSYSTRIRALLDYCRHKGGFEEWQKNKKKIKK